MTETRVRTEDLRAAIERSGYYPGLVTDAVASALGQEPVTAFFVHHDAIFDPGHGGPQAHDGAGADPDQAGLLAHRRAPGRGA